MQHIAGLMGNPSPPFRGEREGPTPQAWEGEVGSVTARSAGPHLTPALSAPWGGEGDAVRGRRIAQLIPKLSLPTPAAPAGRWGGPLRAGGRPAAFDAGGSPPPRCGNRS